MASMGHYMFLLCGKLKIKTSKEWVKMLRRMPIVVGLSLALISPAQADFEMTFEAQPVEEDADSKAELREAISA